MRIGIAQINPTVGDLRGNFDKILGAYQRLAAAGAELVLAPELATTGYPPQDLVFKSRFVPQNLEAVERLHECIGAVPLLVGYVDRNEGRGKPFFNAAALLERGQPIRKSFKTLLPTYDVFDEDRYFEPAPAAKFSPSPDARSASRFAKISGPRITCRARSMSTEIIAGLVAQGRGVHREPQRLALQRAQNRHAPRDDRGQRPRASARPIVYCNVVGGNDQLVFDGSSIAFNRAGDLIAQLPVLPDRRSHRRHRFDEPPFPCPRPIRWPSCTARCR